MSLAGAWNVSAAYADEIDVDGRQRTYEIHVPPGAEVGAGAPLVVAFHGQGGTGQAQAVLSGMNATADSYGFVVAYPDGVALDHSALQPLLRSPPRWRSSRCWAAPLRRRSASR